MLQCHVGGSRTRHTCTSYFNAVNFSSQQYRNSSSFLNGGDAPTATNAVVGPTNTYLLSSLNTDTFRLLRLRDVTDTSYLNFLGTFLMFLVPSYNNLIAHNVIHQHVIQRIAGLRRLSAMQLELCPSIQLEIIFERDYCCA